ncbi:MULTISPECIES: acyltransferase [unclassified Frigoribacterium]|uniref:acyltransferase family protein n=1 Tax=unclassified Frigoribacterium TaxID=2627005 RepID=UPI0024742DBC|nr:acyltransferase [Frigoribacterium sp. PvP121]
MQSVSRPVDQANAARLPRRDRSLDGLRGLAAMVVVIHHSLLVIPAFAAPYDGIRAAPSIAWLTYSPLHVVWAGREAVYVFFILSGLVLTASVMKSPAFSWVAYYPSRLLRLYLPVWASIGVAVLLMTSVPREFGVGDSSWVKGHDEIVTGPSVLRDAVLVTGTSGINSALWSLRWEVIFSVLLPLVVLVAVKFQHLWHVVVAASLLAVAAGTALNVTALQFLPLFFIGAIMAPHLERLRRLGALIDLLKRPAITWAGLFVGAVFLTTSYWTLSLISGRGIFRLAAVLEVVGAGLLVALAIVMPTFKRALESRLVLFLGGISFSLYLVHEPIVVAISELLPAGSKAWTLMLAVPVSLAVAYAFFKAVEGPSHKLSRRVHHFLIASGPASRVTQPAQKGTPHAG